MAPDTDVSGRHDRSTSGSHALDPTGVRTSPHPRPAGFSVGYENYEVWLDPANTDSCSIERVDHHRLSELFTEEQWGTIFHDDTDDIPKPSFFSHEEWNQFLLTTDNFEEELGDIENQYEDLPEGEEKMLEEIWLTCKRVLASEKKLKEADADEFIMHYDDDTSGGIINEVAEPFMLNRIRLPTSDETETETVFYDSDNIPYDMEIEGVEHLPKANITTSNEEKLVQKGDCPSEDKMFVPFPGTSVSAHAAGRTGNERVCRWTTTHRGRVPGNSGSGEKGRRCCQ